MEVAGRENIPSSGPIIIALNHANSMADTALSMTALYPLFIRYTCKDTLLKDPKFGWFVRGIKSIGIKRKQDHKNKNIDNTDAFDALYRELSNDCIVGMYPEGVGRYKSSLSPFRTGLARIAINFILQYPQKSVHILPVGLNYLHREKFRSSVAVRIGKPILLNSDIIKQKQQPLGGTNEDEARSLDLSSDEIYKIGKNITNDLSQTFDDLVISSPNWKMLKLAHLARSIAFPESSSPKRTYLTHYIDLGRQFNTIFRDKSDDKMVSKCYEQLSSYWNVLWQHGLKDYRILQMTQCQRNYNISSRNWRKISLCTWFLYRLGSAIYLLSLSMPVMASASPIFAIWQYLRMKRIRKGIEGNFDGLAMNKMFMHVFGVPLLSVLYGCVIMKKFGRRKGGAFGILYPFVYWLSVRLWQEGYASLRSARSLLKILFMSRKTENYLVECRKNVSYLVFQIVQKYYVKYDHTIMSEVDKDRAPRIKRANMHWITRFIRARTKDDWNETIRLYDVPTDEFHLNDKISRA